MESPVSATKAEQQKCEETNTEHEQSLSSTLDVGGLFLSSDSDSAVVLDTSATATPACFSWLEHHNRTSERKAYRKAPTYLSSARFRFRDGRPGEVRRGAEIPLGIAGSKGKFTALPLDAEIPAPLREGALEALGGKLDC